MFSTKRNLVVVASRIRVSIYVTILYNDIRPKRMASDLKPCVVTSLLSRGQPLPLVRRRRGCPTLGTKPVHANESRQRFARKGMEGKSQK